MKHVFHIIYLMFFISLIYGTLATSGFTEPYSWMEPENPTENDHISIYCRAPGASRVSFTVCDDETQLCYLLMNETKIDSDTWKIDIYGTLDEGTKAHYEITVIYQDESTGNETEKKIGPVHFTVGSSPDLDEYKDTPGPGIAIFIFSTGVGAIAWKRIKN